MIRLLAKGDGNPKVAKNGIVSNVWTAPLHLSPASLSGRNVCPMATEGCKAVCLHYAGNPMYMKNKFLARQKRTDWFFDDRAAFMVQLEKEIDAHLRKAHRLGMACALRLNATSDIPWHRIPVTVRGKTYKNLMERFPTIKFYDYTKISKRFSEKLPRNYYLTYSLSETEWSRIDAVELLTSRRASVAVPFNILRGHPLPKKYLGFRVVDGDLTDYRPNDPRGVIIGLRAKGEKAKHDLSGFIVRDFLNA